MKPISLSQHNNETSTTKQPATPASNETTEVARSPPHHHHSPSTIPRRLFFGWRRHAVDATSTWSARPPLLAVVAVLCFLARCSSLLACLFVGWFYTAWSLRVVGVKVSSLWLSL